MIKKLLVLCLILCSVTVFPEDKEMPPFEIPTTRNNGMGGNYTAYTDTVFALLVNPAAIMRVKQKSTFAFSPALLNPKRAYDVAASMKDAAGAVVQGDAGALTGVLEVFKGGNDTPTGFDLREFPFAFAWVSNGLGLGLWSRAFVEPDTAGSQKQLKLYADVILPVGFALKILETNAHSIDVGITLKPFARVIVQGELDEQTLIDDGLDQDFSSIPLIAGTGFDVGVMYRWDMGLNIGFTLNDIITRGKTVYALRGDMDDYSYYVPFTMNLGAAFDLKIGNYWPSAPSALANMGIALAVNLDDAATVLRPGYNPQDLLMDLRAGLQLSLFDILVLSGGMREKLPAAGIGVNLGFTRIDLAYYEKRFAGEQGGFTIPVAELTIAARPKAKEKDWSWTRRSLLGAITRSEKL